MLKADYEYIKGEDETMVIETKYNIGDEVWFRNPSGKIVCDKITVVWVIRVMPHEQEVWYQLKCYTHRKESQLFPTKEELIKNK